MIAKMDMYLDWHHGNLRAGIGGYTWNKHFAQNMTGVKAPPERVDEAIKVMKRSLQQVSRIWLAPDRQGRFMFGDQPSIADLLLAGELTQLEGVGMESFLKENSPSIHKWLHEEMCSMPIFKEIHEQGVAKVAFIVKALDKKYAK